jgi:hypothetical protein
VYEEALEGKKRDKDPAICNKEGNSVSIAPLIDKDSLTIILVTFNVSENKSEYKPLTLAGVRSIAGVFCQISKIYIGT